MTKIHNEEDSLYFKIRHERAIAAAAEIVVEIATRASQVTASFDVDRNWKSIWIADISVRVKVYAKTWPANQIPPSYYAGKIAVAFFNGAERSNNKFHFGIYYDCFAADAAELCGWHIDPACKRMKRKAFRNALNIVLANYEGFIMATAERLMSMMSSDDYAEIFWISNSGSIESKDFELWEEV